MTQVTGILTDELGTVLANTTCAVVAIDQVVGQDGGGRVSRGSIVVTDGAGEFDADIKPGRYELVVEASAPADANVKFSRIGRLTVLTTGPMTLEEALDTSFGPINPSILQQAIDAKDAAEAAAVLAQSAYQGRQYETRALFVADTDYVNGADAPVDGTVVTAGGLQYVRSAGAAALPGLPGWLPFGTPTILHFGATGAGDQAVDEAAWAAAVAWADELFIPEGTYIMRRAKLRPADKCRHVHGVYGKSILLHPAMDLGTGSSSVVDFYGTDADTLLTGLLVENLVIDGNKDNLVGGDANNCEGTDVDFCQGAKLQNLIVRNCKSDGIDWDDCIDCSASNILGIDCGGMAVHISSNCERVHTYDSGAIRCGLDNGRPGFDTWSSATHCSINNCWTFECYRGFNSRGVGNAVRGFTAIASAGWGGWIDGTGGNISDVTIDGASVGAVEANNAGLQLNCTDYDMSNVRVQNVTGAGVRSSAVRTTITGLTVNDATGNAIQFFASALHNKVIGFKASGAPNGIQDSGTNNSVSEIEIDGVTAVGVRALGTSGRFGPGNIRNAGTDGAELDGTDNKFIELECDTLGGAGFRIQSTAVRPRMVECNATNWTSVRFTNASATLSILGGFNGTVAPVIGNASVTDSSIFSGVYIYLEASGSSGGPSGVNEGVLHHTRRLDTGGETQMLIERGSPERIFTRSRTTGSWSSWSINWNSKNTTVDGDGFIKVLP